MPTQSEYAQAGVDYTKIASFKELMQSVAQRTATFPNRRKVLVETNLAHSHGGVYRYRGTAHTYWVQTTEGLGQKNWMAEWMYLNTGVPHYRCVGIDTAMMAVNDCLAHGAMPVAYTDEVAVGSDTWFQDMKRAQDLAAGFYEACKLAGMALVAGESPALRYLMKPEPPVVSAPSLSGCVVGLVAPLHRLITGEKLRVGDRIIGVASSGMHSNGSSLLIKRALAKEGWLLTQLPNGKMLGEEILTPTECYVRLVEQLQEADITIHAIVPGTGGRVAKIAIDKRPYTYHIQTWPEVPLLFQFLLEEGVSLMDCLTTFNWGIGYYLFVHSNDVAQVLRVAAHTGYKAWDLGQVKEGPRQVIFGPEKDLVLPPPGE